MFFSFDGIDGTGKSTQMGLFCGWLRSRQIEVVECRDPGSTHVGEQIRDIVLHSDPLALIDRRTEMLLYMAARAQLVEEVIRPALAAGKTVVSDRYLMANLVYQGHAGGLDVDTLREVGLIATAGLMPDCVFLLDMPTDAARARLCSDLDRMESRGNDYQTRLREGFLAEAARPENRAVVIDALGRIDDVQSAIQNAAEKRIP